jgi:ferric-dicitrate binding protein FerR (iron transport regulator)
MTDEQNRQDGRAANALDLVGQLIHTAGRRPEPPQAAYVRTLDIATAALAAKIAGRRRRQRVLALAASVLAAVVAVTVYSNRPVEAPAQVAQVERVIGAVEWAPSRGSPWTLLRGENAALGRGSQLRSQAGSKAGLVLADGTSLRVAGETEIEIESATRVTLWQGMVYVDTAGTGGGVEIVTMAGTARDVGTQFEVAYNGADYRLRIRAGRVLLERGPLEAAAAAGEEISFSADGPLLYGRLARNDPRWQWVEDVAPVPDIDGQPVRVLLDWVARETGRPIRFEDARVERMASGTTLHGTIRRLAPLDALAVMLATTDLDHRLLADGTILITSRSVADEVL